MPYKPTPYKRITPPAAGSKCDECTLGGTAYFAVFQIFRELRSTYNERPEHASRNDQTFWIPEARHQELLAADAEYARMYTAYEEANARRNEIFNACGGAVLRYEAGTAQVECGYTGPPLNPE